jgi:deoxyribonuclease I
MIRALFALFILCSPFASEAATGIATLDRRVSYYGEEFYSKAVTRLKDRDLIRYLGSVLSSTHLRQPGKMDVVTPCEPGDRCYRHTALEYKDARRLVLTELFKIGGSPDPKTKEVYCTRDYSIEEIVRSAAQGQPSAINVEHTWPQSRFNKGGEDGAQKSDLHHLFPSHAEMNRIRANKKFGDVERAEMTLPCPQSKLGSVKGLPGDYFEPPVSHKGNVARALFYFAVRYSVEIDDDEEFFLRRWMKQDPVDTEERSRNNRIHELQGNRNPFVDHPELVELISNF